MTEAEALARLATARAGLEPLGDVTVVALGYATLDLDEAEAEAKATIAPEEVKAAPDDVLLGARCRIIITRRGPWIVLLEPSTEGRLAASLARYGQGPVAEYLAATDGAEPDAAAGIVLSRPAPGPLGTSRLVLGGPPWGPHLVLVDEDPRGAPAPPAATIES